MFSFDRTESSILLGFVTPYSLCFWTNSSSWLFSRGMWRTSVPSGARRIRNSLWSLNSVNWARKVKSELTNIRSLQSLYSWWNGNPISRKLRIIFRINKKKCSFKKYRGNLNRCCSQAVVEQLIWAKTWTREANPSVEDCCTRSEFSYEISSP